MNKAQTRLWKKQKHSQHSYNATFPSPYAALFSLGSAGLEALSVDDARSGLVILLFGHPHLLEGRQRSQNGATNPDRVLSLGRSDDLDLHRAGSQGGDLLLHPVSNTRVHGGATRQDSVSVQVLSDINVTLHDRVEGRLVNAVSLVSDEGRLEHGLGASESLVANGDDLSVGKFVRLFQGGGGGRRGHFLLEVQGDVAQLFLHVSHDFSLGCGYQGDTPLSQDLHEVI